MLTAAFIASQPNDKQVVGGFGFFLFKTLKRKENKQGFPTHFMASSVSLALSSQPAPTTSSFIMTPTVTQNLTYLEVGVQLCGEKGYRQ